MLRYKSIFDLPRSEVFKRPGGSYTDDRWNIVYYDDIVLEGVTGDLQIYTSKPITQIEAPEGYTLQGAYWFSTTYQLNTMDDATAQAADFMEKDGRKWYVWRKVFGTEGPLSTDAYNEYILLLQGLPNEGSP